MSYRANPKINICENENQALLFHEDQSDISTKSTWISWIPKSYYIVVSMALSLTFFLIVTNKFNLETDIKDFFDELDVEIIIHRDGYKPIYSVSQTDNGGSSTYDIFKDYSGIIEPHSPMIFEVANPVVGFAYKYSLFSDDSKKVVSNGSLTNRTNALSTLSSESIYIFCNSYETFLLKIKIFSSKKGDDTLVLESTFPIICMYVRREIRKLLLEDLNKTLDAMLVLSTTNEEEGRAKYGDNFHSASYFTEWHFFNAAQQDADHIHEGMGFVLQHIKTTNQFELAMQSVDPSVSLPYWDFTIEGEAGMTIDQSPIFTPGIFGNCPLPNNLEIGFSYSQDSMLDAAIPNGRWAYLEAALNTKYTTMKQPYGYLRAPWNMNPSPYISRYTYPGSIQSLPTCSNFLNLINMTDLTLFLTEIAFDTHGATHTLPGGLMGCELLQPFIDLGYIRGASLLKLCAKWGFVIKSLYRSYAITLPTGCIARSYDYSGIDGCPFICEDVAEIGMSAPLYMLAFGYTMTDPYEGNVSYSTYIANFICSGNASKIYVGDHLESSSPADPSFWVIHPTLDRAMQVKYLSGGFENNDWPVNDSEICQNYLCYEDDSGNYGSSTECCYGHHLMDQAMDHTSGNRSNYIGATNQETLWSLDPRESTGTYSMSYVYDDFLWTHCEDDGVSMAQLLASLKSKYLI